MHWSRSHGVYLQVNVVTTVLLGLIILARKFGGSYSSLLVRSAEIPHFGVSLLFGLKQNSTICGFPFSSLGPWVFGQNTYKDATAAFQ